MYRRCSSPVSRQQVQQLMLSGQIQPSPRDTVSFPLWRMLLIGPPGSQQERMYKPRRHRSFFGQPTRNWLMRTKTIAAALPYHLA